MDVFSPAGKGNSDYVWMLPPKLARRRRRRRKKDTVRGETELYPFSGSFHLFWGVTSFKRHWKPVHSAALTGFMFCGFTVSVFKVLSEDSFRCRRLDQQPFNTCQVKTRWVVLFFFFESLKLKSKKNNEKCSWLYFLFTQHAVEGQWSGNTVMRRACSVFVCFSQGKRFLF